MECSTQRRMKPLMTEEECCAFLRVSRDALAKFRADDADPIPFMKVGRRYVYDEGHVRKWALRAARRQQEADRKREKSF